MSRKVHMTIDPSPDIIEALADQMQKTPGLLRTALKRQGTRFKTRMLGELRTEPGKPSYPIRWKSEKQRRAYYATDGFGRGIGAPRTHALSQGWRVDIDDSQFLSFEVHNIKDYAIYVQGDDQQPFHIDTAWNYAPRIIADERERFEDVLIDTYFTVADPTAGVF